MCFRQTRGSRYVCFRQTRGSRDPLPPQSQPQGCRGDVVPAEGHALPAQVEGHHFRSRPRAKVIALRLGYAYLL